MSHKIYCSELNHFFNSYWKTNSEFAATIINMPEVEDDSEIVSGSFIEMLFSTTFNYDDYEYMFKNVEASTFQKNIRDRLLLSSSLIKCYICASEQDYTDNLILYNIFNISDDDLLLLDKLYEYRTDSTCDISEITYTLLSTKLSKLIYIYLDLVLNNNYTYLNAETIISSNENNLENLFELYVINEAHKIISVWETIIDTGVLELRPISTIVTVTDEMITDSEIQLENEVYQNELDLFINGNLINDSDFNIENQNTITWSDLSISENDIAVIKYLTRVNVDDTGILPSEINIEPIGDDLEWLDGGGGVY